MVLKKTMRDIVKVGIRSTQGNELSIMAGLSKGTLREREREIELIGDFFLYSLRCSFTVIILIVTTFIVPLL